jgi:V/A-type H+-transporting ATPase subunit F
VISMYKIAVIGGKDTIIGFKALGLATFAVSDSETTKKMLRRLVKSDDCYAIIYIEETFARDVMDEINKYKDSITPAIILIPGRDGSLGLAQSALEAAVDRAVGADIL